MSLPIQLPRKRWCVFTERRLQFRGGFQYALGVAYTAAYGRHHWRLECLVWQIDVLYRSAHRVEHDHAFWLRSAKYRTTLTNNL